MAVTSLLLGSGIPGIIDAPVQFDPNNPHNRHAQDVYNHAAIQVALSDDALHLPAWLKMPLLGVVVPQWARLGPTLVTDSSGSGC